MALIPTWETSVCNTNLVKRWLTGCTWRAWGSGMPPPWRHPIGSIWADSFWRPHVGLWEPGSGRARLGLKRRSFLWLGRSGVPASTGLWGWDWKCSGWAPVAQSTHLRWAWGRCCTWKFPSISGSHCRSSRSRWASVPAQSGWTRPFSTIR